MKAAGTVVLILGLGLSAAARASAEEPLRRVSRMDSRTESKAREAMAKGLKFLEASQLPDGGWRGFEGGDPAISALVAKCFAQDANYGPKHPVTQRAFSFIAHFAQEDGGIYLPGSGLRNYYTSVALLALAQSPDPEHREIVIAGQKFLTNLQWDEGEEYAKDHVWYGGAGYGRGKRPDLSNTQMMLEALHASGLSPEHPTYRKALVFISRCQMLPETNDQAFAKGGDGGFIYSPANGGESKAGQVETAEGQPARLRSYGSMTYAGFKSLLYAGVSRDDSRVQAAVKWIKGHYTLAHNPNMPLAQSKEGLYYYYHVFSRALTAWGVDTIVDANGTTHNWRNDLCQALLVQQRPDGSWVNESDRWYESNPNLVTAYSVLALQSALK